MTIPPPYRRLIETLLHGLAITLGILRANYNSLPMDEQDKIHDAAEAITSAAVECISSTRRRGSTRRRKRKSITKEIKTANG